MLVLTMSPLEYTFSCIPCAFTWCAPGMSWSCRLALQPHKVQMQVPVTQQVMW
jgi:hypothetical protein